MKQFQVEQHADSYLPEDKNWKLVWSDEFDGTELDRSKWGFRLNFWGQRFPAFTDEGVVLDGKSHLQLHLIKKDGIYCSPHLQTGSLTFDIPKDTKGFWPFGKPEEPKFMHRYGYYEIRCRMPKYDGWHSAFWLQSPSIGAHPDPGRAGVECDIMENYRQFKEGKIIGGNLWGGYGKDYKGSGHFSWDWKETEDGWHYYAKKRKGATSCGKAVCRSDRFPIRNSSFLFRRSVMAIAIPALIRLFWIRPFFRTTLKSTTSACLTRSDFVCPRGMTKTASREPCHRDAEGKWIYF